MSPESILWSPSERQIESSNISGFSNQVTAATGRAFETYTDLYQWSLVSCPVNSFNYITD